MLVALTLFSFIAYSDDYLFEVGPRVGYMIFKDDLVDKGFTYGVQGSYYLDPSMRLRLSFDRFSSGKSKENHELTYTYSWQEQSSNQWADDIFVYTNTTIDNYTNYYYVNWTLAYEIDVKPLFLEFNYLWDLKNDFSVYAGAGVGISFNKMKTESYFSSGNSASQSITANLNDSVSVRGNLDNSYIYGLTGGGSYKLYDNLTIGVDAAYIWNKPDASVSITTPQGSERHKFDVNMNSIGVFVNCNYLF